LLVRRNVSPTSGLKDNRVVKPPAAAGGYSHDATPWLIASRIQFNLLKCYRLIAFLVLFIWQGFYEDNALSMPLTGLGITTS